MEEAYKDIDKDMILEEYGGYSKFDKVKDIYDYSKLILESHFVRNYE